MSKAADAFRTISEVADDLEVPKHVLRFWENRFPQIKPMKRGGGRRYYRPADLELLRGIRHLLHNEGFTIKGVQKILREQGVEIVKACWQPGKSVDAPGARTPPASRVSELREQRRGKSVRAGSARGAAVRPDRKVLMEEIVAELKAWRELLVRPGDVAPVEAKRARARR